MLRNLSVSRYRRFRSCPRKDYFVSVVRAKPVNVPHSLRFGRLIDAGLGQIWQHQPVAFGPGNDPYDVARATAMLDGYEAMWGAPPDNVIAVQPKFTTPLVNPATNKPSRTWQMVVFLDMAAREGSMVVPWEAKTSSDDISPGSPYWRRLMIDTQVSVYFPGAEALGHGSVRELQYDVLGKPQLRPKLATPLDKRKYKAKTGELYANQRAEDETPEEFGYRVSQAIAKDPPKYYQRARVTRLSTEVEEARADLWQTGLAIRNAELTGMWPRNSDACMQWGRPCEYFDVCTGVASIDDPLLFIRRKKDGDIAGPNHQGPQDQAA